MALKSRGPAAEKTSERAVGKRRSSGQDQTVASATRGRESVVALQRTLEAVATRLHRERVLKPGSIVIRAEEAASAAIVLRATDTGVQVEAGGEHPDALLEVMGDPRRINAVLNGSKDARMQFFAGGIRVRGDMHYLSELGMQLGFLKKPIV